MDDPIVNVHVYGEGVGAAGACHHMMYMYHSPPVLQYLKPGNGLGTKLFQTFTLPHALYVSVCVRDRLSILVPNTPFY